ncbi:hypothetical protein [Terracoccus luteus]|uniref:Uncharacterized protein n=1 Tax=Terracoccus luteus TaxID=53356 RepID=A0A839PZC7_9MICO|nr:hypothetical protein [Terracoccus luteus]MBB2988513.1 hypothetical protein [Terracoccus luteus]MCP2174163.1 hypothetical protein [Terracoccus luteus]
MGKPAKKRRDRPRRTVEKPLDVNAWLDSLPDVPPTPAVDDATYQDPDALLAEVIDHYLGSREFNGLPVGESAGPHANAEKLIRDGLIQLVTSTDYLNTHIRPWVRDDLDRQVAELKLVAAGGLSGCLYPTPNAMEAHVPALTHTHPYRDRMTMGGGALELAFFDLAAVEGYVNDPDFTFEFGDDGFRFSTAPDSGENDDDLLTLEAGYAYDHTVDYRGDDAIRRYWTAFLCDLVGLPARHQTRLSTFERDSKNLSPHPDWWQRLIDGRWLDHIGPFTKILSELKAINELWNIAFDSDLFATTDRPRAWGWVLRPTTGSWNEFIHLTDKLLSDNLQPKGLDAAGAPKTDAKGNNIGTLGRLQELIVASSSSATPEAVRSVLEPLREVRKERQAPAHKIADTLTDGNVVNNQRDLLRDVAYSLEAIRAFVQTHPEVRSAGWKPPIYLDNWRWL